jgi:hypothetical protein
MMYDLRMKTLLIHGRSPLPGALREVVQRGSTSVEDWPAAELDDLERGPIRLDADRIVFWAAAGDDDDDEKVRRLASRYARAEAAERKEKLVFVSTDPASVALPDLSPHELFVWPRDEDRLKMAFMTGG